MRTLWLLLAMLTADAVQGADVDTGAGAPIRAEAVRLDPRDPARTRLGALTYLGGWVLTSTDPRFGGLSAMTRDGDGFLAISDRGALVRIEPRGNRPPRGYVAGLLPDGPPLRMSGHGRDAESSTRDAEGNLWVGFEGANAIWRYDAAVSRATGDIAPKAMADWPGNGGPEAMLRLADGRFLVFSEEAKGARPGTYQALLFPGDPVEGGEPARFDYRPPAGYVITDIRLLPDGRLLALHRRYTRADGVSAILSIVDPAAIGAGSDVRGQPIARLAPPLMVDNMEALEVTRESGKTILWIASDDNFSSVQRTLLMRFRID